MMTSTVVVSKRFPKIEISGLEFYAGSFEGAAVGVATRSGFAEGGGYACLCNVHVFVEALGDKGVRAALRGASIVFPDGMPIVWLINRVGGTKVDRVAGPDLMLRILDLGQETGLRHFLLGSSETTLSDLRHGIVRQFPSVGIVGVFSPPVEDVWNPSRELVESIRVLRPDIIWCALGAPKQELWMARNARLFAPAILVGVGAAFDFHAGAKRRAPRWLQNLGLEWLFRLCQEPRRLGSRYLRSNAIFVAVAVRMLAHRTFNR